MGRVFLRHPTRADYPAFADLVRESVTLHRPWVEPPTTYDEFVAYVVRARSANFRGLLVCRRGGVEILGVYNVSQIVLGRFRSACLGYYADARHAKKGYMSAGMHVLLRHAFGKLGLHRLEANIQPGNASSIALARSCGFEKEGYSPGYLKIAGRWRDHERWAIRREVWRRSRRSGLPVVADERGDR